MQITKACFKIETLQSGSIGYYSVYFTALLANWIENSVLLGENILNSNIVDWTSSVIDTLNNLKKWKWAQAWSI
jgi:hypothetical protein